MSRGERRSRPPKHEGGFSLLASVIALAMIGVSAGSAVIFISQLRDISRERLSMDALDVLKQTITGNKALIINEGRSDFGYVGHMGTVPSAIEDLYKKGTQPAFVFNTTKKVGAGWEGPYIAPLIIEHLDALKEDSFGNDYEFTNTEFEREGDGETVSVRIKSLGKDGISGTSYDRSVDIIKLELFSTVSGFVTDKKGAGKKDVGTTLNLPLNGELSTKYATTDLTGKFTFSDVSFGLRSISIDPRLAYQPDSGKAKGGQKENVEFKVTNAGTDGISIDSIEAVYAGTAFYEEIKVAGVKVFDYTDHDDVRGASGDLPITFTTQTVGGSGKPIEVVLIRVETDTTTTPNIIVKGVGETITIEYKKFMNLQEGDASIVNMVGVTFTVTFSDGSEVTFTTSV
jgi:type II secretory pathway pseudopilin PulG